MNNIFYDSCKNTKGFFEIKAMKSMNIVLLKYENGESDEYVYSKTFSLKSIFNDLSNSYKIRILENAKIN